MIVAKVLRNLHSKRMLHTVLFCTRTNMNKYSCKVLKTARNVVLKKAYLIFTITIYFKRIASSNRNFQNKSIWLVAMNEVDPIFQIETYKDECSHHNKN